MNYYLVVIFSFLLALYKFYFHKFTRSRKLTSEQPSDTNALSTINFLYVNKILLLWCIAILFFLWIISKKIIIFVWLSDFNSFVLIDQQQNTECDNKVQKHVTFSEDDNNSNKENSAETVRNFFMMESSTTEQKANFMVGGDLEEIEEKDEFPPPRIITKQLSDAALIDKRRRLR